MLKGAPREALALLSSFAFSEVRRAAIGPWHDSGDPTRECITAVRFRPPPRGIPRTNCQSFIHGLTLQDKLVGAEHRQGITPWTVRL